MRARVIMIQLFKPRGEAREERGRVEGGEGRGGGEKNWVKLTERKCCQKKDLSFEDGRV